MPIRLVEMSTVVRRTLSIVNSAITVLLIFGLYFLWLRCRHNDNHNKCNHKNNNGSICNHTCAGRQQDPRPSPPTLETHSPSRLPTKATEEIIETTCVLLLHGHVHLPEQLRRGNDEKLHHVLPPDYCAPDPAGHHGLQDGQQLSYI